MWSNQLKDIAIQLAKKKDIKDRLSIIEADKALSKDQRTALKLAYAAPNKVTSNLSSSSDYWS